MNDNENEICPYILWICILLMVVLAMSFFGNGAYAGDTWPNEMPPAIIDDQIWDAAKEAMREKYTPPKCFQVIDTAAGASVCITEAEWVRLHSDGR